MIVKRKTLWHDTNGVMRITLLGAGILLLVILGVMLWMMWPIISPPDVPETVGDNEIEVHMGEVTMYGYTIEGPIERDGVMTTHITAERVVAKGFTEMVAGTELYAPAAELVDFEMYCTYLRGTADAFGITATTGWHGDQSPPAMLVLMGDPLTMTDVTAFMTYHSSFDNAFDGMQLAAPESGIDAGSEAVSMSVDNSFKIKADRMEMDLASGIFELMAGILTNSLDISAENVLMENVLMEIPMEGGGSTLIGLDSAVIAGADMRLTSMNAITLMVGDLFPMLGGILGQRIVLADVELVVEGMEAQVMDVEGMTMDGVETTGIWAIDGMSGITIESEKNSFTMAMDVMEADAMEITGFGTTADGRQYMVMEVSSLTVEAMEIWVPHGDRIMKIGAATGTIDSAVMWAFDVDADGALFEALAVTDAPHQMDISEPVRLENVVMHASVMVAEGIAMTSMTQDVVNG